MPRTQNYGQAHVVGTIGMLAGILGTLFAVYAYHQTVSRPEISWAMSSQIIFDQHSATSALTLLDAQGQKITENTYAAEFTVWNSGNERFDDVDNSTIIREPLTFRLVGTTGHIVSAAITDELHNINSAWAIKSDQQSAVMTWAHFDPDAAAKVLILYTGDGSGTVIPEIGIAGHSVLKQVKNEASKWASSLRALALPLKIMIFGAIIVGMYAQLASLWNDMARLDNRARIRWFLTLFGLMFGGRSMLIEFTAPAFIPRF